MTGSPDLNSSRSGVRVSPIDLRSLVADELWEYHRSVLELL